MENLPLRYRIGNFFLLAGLFLLLLFLGAVLAESGPWAGYLFSGIIALILAFLLRRSAPPPPPSNRFSGIRKMRENAQKRRAARQQKQQEKKKK